MLVCGWTEIRSESIIWKESWNCLYPLKTTRLVPFIRQIMLILSLDLFLAVKYLVKRWLSDQGASRVKSSLMQQCGLHLSIKRYQKNFFWQVIIHSGQIRRNQCHYQQQFLQKKEISASKSLNQDNLVTITRQIFTLHRANLELRYGERSPALKATD